MTETIENNVDGAESETCSDCAAWNCNVGEIEGECRFDPPKVHVVLVPTQTIQGPAMNAQILSLFPRTKIDMFCMSFIDKHHPA